MSKETFRFDVVLRVEIETDRTLYPEEVEAVAEAISKVLSPYSPARDAVIDGLYGCRILDKVRGDVNAWFEFPWKEHKEVSE